MTYSALVAGVAAVVIGVLLLTTRQSADDGHSAPVLRRAWPTDSDPRQATAATRIARIGKPVVFSGAPSDEWELRELFSTLAGFVKHLGPQTEIDNVFHIANASVLFFNPAMPMANSRRVPWQAPFSHVRMTTDKFAQYLSNGENGHDASGGAYYYSGKVGKDTCLSRVADAVTEENIEEFTVHKDGTPPSEDPEAVPQVHLWLGERSFFCLRTHFVCETYHADWQFH
jgi:hypothetical protein